MKLHPAANSCNDSFSLSVIQIMATEGKHKVPIVKSHTSHAANKAKSQDEIMKKFSKNFRRLMETRENVPGSPKSVSFNPETVETSFGGSQTPGQIKDTSVHLDFSVVDARRKEQNATKDQDCGDSTLESTDESITTSKDNASNETSRKPGSLSTTSTKTKLQTNGHLSKDRSSKTKPLQTNDTEKTVRVKSAPVLKNVKSKLNGGLPNQFKPDCRSTTPVTQVAECKTPKKTHLNGTTNSNFQTPDRQYTLDHLKDPLHTSGTPECFNPVTFETPRCKPRWSSGDTSGSNSSMESDASSMTVAVRVRPFSSR